MTRRVWPFRASALVDLIHLGAMAAAVVLALVTYVAVVHAGSRLISTWRTFPAQLGWHWITIDVVLLAALVLGLAIILRLRRHRLLFALAIAATLRLGAVVLIESPVIADWERYHRIAIRIAEGGAPFDIVPTGWPLALSIPYAVFGPQPWLGGLLNAAFGVATVWLVFRLAAPRFGEVAAGVGAYLLAVSPDQVFMTPILGSETLYAMLVTGAAAVLFVPGVTAVVASGIALGASQYVRATTIYVIVAFLAVMPMLPQWRRKVLAILVAVAIVLVPVLVHNRVTHEEWSIATSRFGGWTLLIGTNQTHNGTYNVDDLRFVGVPPETDEGNRIAREEAIRRITSDPVGFGGLVVRKFNVLWGPGYWGIRAAGADWPADQQRGLSMAAQLVYAAMMVLAAAVGWRLRRDPLVILVLALVAVTSAVHSFIEVSDRYHAFVVPLVCLLAGVQIARLWTRSGRGDTTEPPNAPSSVGPMAPEPTVRAPSH